MTGVVVGNLLGECAVRRTRKRRLPHSAADLWNAILTMTKQCPEGNPGLTKHSRDPVPSTLRSCSGFVERDTDHDETVPGRKPRPYEALERSSSIYAPFVQRGEAASDRSDRCENAIPSPRHFSMQTEDTRASTSIPRAASHAVVGSRSTDSVKTGRNCCSVDFS